MTDLNMRRLMVTWLIGSIVGTLLIAVTSPLFVRSYLRRDIEPLRGVRAMPVGSTYRWRSEGYANTLIGQFGMPGKTTHGQPSQDVLRIALWGDSQAEGVSVADDQKLFAQVEQISGGNLAVFPLARSGDDVSDWVKQIPGVQRELAIDLHVVLIVDLPDLLIRETKQIDAVSPEIITNLPAFLIQSSRNLITDAQRGTIRKLRFTAGPIDKPPIPVSRQTVLAKDWKGSIQRLRDSTDKPILVVYAPPSPHITAGTLRFGNEAAEEFATIKTIAEDQGLRVINVHEALCESARSGRWPHGFHNGQIGSGHLNAVGYAVIAKAIGAAVESER